MPTQAVDETAKGRHMTTDTKALCLDHEKRMGVIEVQIAKAGETERRIEAVEVTFAKGFEEVRGTQEVMMGMFTDIKDYLFGGGSKDEGIIPNLERRVLDAETRDQFKTKIKEGVDAGIKLELARLNIPSATPPLLIPARPSPETTAGLVKQILKDVPPWAWVMMTALLGPGFLEKVVVFITSMHGLWNNG